MDAALIGGGILHVLSRKLLLWKLLWDKNCRGISLITQELFLIIFIFRYLDLLYLYVSLANTIVKVFHLVVALAIVLLMRYSPASQTYDADLDTFPRGALILPCLILAIFLNRVKLIIEICHSFSVYLEVVALVPQFVLLYKRQIYEGWALAFTVLCGAERLLQGISVVTDWQESYREDPYSVLADMVHAVVFISGLAVVIWQRFQVKKQQGMNESGAQLPNFDEVWDASKFKFEDQEAVRGETVPVLGRR
ncbi:hypothetical protein VOLCADRAFT_116279 [Volvox carteri f. nagariensis]|uniref:Uncharacterized protein n=1 Tax=Volvox carteri f. nagariensis TaxID=3068 RepID=D8TKG9_VOLCA|nr:uncharacterized protein VOLCADRAFT_116279 [Volvox carteri f. nagariensis]EFJ52062.1 hypothetical protein VOLCADRAFT_116279 [Volvox carteri f. nagariensis]|eukprot:XP_002946836.1 hypothetical protein VOLCADRAFT_116279 [Volvox carteri f. nagariensis]